MTDTLTQPLNKSIKESVDPNSIDPSLLTESMVSVDYDRQKKLLKRYKIVSGVGICLVIVGFFLFLAMPPIIHSQIVSQAIDQSVLSKDNEDFWAHFPGSSGTIITRNYSFFNMMNEEEMFLHGEKPKFKEYQGYILQEMEDYFNITYSDDGKFVHMKDWLHFEVYKDSRDIDGIVKPINVPSLGYWHTLKNSRDALVFLQGFALLFNNIEISLIDTVLGQGIKAQFTADFQTTYLELLQPAGISLQNSHFIWNDYAYGMQNINNMKYWVQAAKTSFTKDSKSFSDDALNLKDYFTLSDSEMRSIIFDFKEFISTLEGLIFENHYCVNITEFPCDGRELAVRQIAESYVTQDTPPVSSIIPTDTICRDNGTCNGFYPEISSYFTNVYMKEHPQSDPFLKFSPDLVRKWLDYNPGRIQGDYNKAESALLHIGNLDALFDNGTCFDNAQSTEETRQECLKNLQNRFQLPSPNHTKVFWAWIKYLLNNLLRQKTEGNEFLGVGLLFTKGLISSFNFLQDNLQHTILRAMIRNKLKSRTCDGFITLSLQTEEEGLVANVCNSFGHDISSDIFVDFAIGVCENKFRGQWEGFRKLGASITQIQSFCDAENAGGFGELYDAMRVEINDYYSCEQTPNRYCSNYELALKQWANSSVTLKPPPSAEEVLFSSTTFQDWNKSASAFQFYHFGKKFPNKTIPVYDSETVYKLFNYDNIFSATYAMNLFRESKTSQLWKDYIRYIAVFVGLRGLTHERTARDYILGFNDEMLMEIKESYAPFGGDPSTPALVAFNDLNLTQEQVTLEMQWWTGKDNPLMTSQFRKINGMDYLTINSSKFNGNETYWVLQSPWAQNDYFYGTSGKQFASDQDNNPNVSIYVPNLQRYGSGNLNESLAYQRYGYDLRQAFLGRSIYESDDQNPNNKKYYQKFFAVFNETSVTGFPLFMTKHYFMNCSDDYMKKVELYGEKGNRITKASHYDDSYVIVEPFSGVAFQSILFLQGNYYHEPDNLFTYNQTTMMPIFSVYRSGNITEDQANELFGELKVALSFKTVFFYVGIIVSLGGATTFGYAFTKKSQLKKQIKKEKKKNKKLSMSLQKKGQQKMLSEDVQSEVKPKMQKEQDDEEQQPIGRQQDQKQSYQQKNKPVENQNQNSDEIGL